MDLEDKYNEAAKAAKQMLRAEEDETLVEDLDASETLDDESWWSSSY